MPHRQPPPAAVRPADLDRRFQAFAIDLALTVVVIATAATVTWFVSDRSGWVALAVAFAAATVTWLVLAVVAGSSGSSPGKGLRGVRLVDHQSGLPIGVGRGLLRDLIRAMAGAPTLGMGLAALGWTVVADPGARRRGWHDQVCRSIVIDNRPLPVEQDEPDAGPRHVVNLTAMRLAHTPSVPAPQAGSGSVPRVEGQTTARLPITPPQPPVPQPVPQPVRPQPPAAPTRTVARDIAPPVPVQPPGSQQPVSQPPQPTGPRWRLTFDTGADFYVDAPVLVGRRPEARPGEQVGRLLPLPSTDMSLSKTHALITVAPDGSLIVIDRGSTNGSVLQRRGGERDLPAGKPATLQPGDKVRFGDREMFVRRDG